MITACYGHAIEVPLTFTSHGHAISWLVFSLDIDQLHLDFDRADKDEDGIYDNVSLHIPEGFKSFITYGAADADGELDISVVDNVPPLSALPDGNFITLTFETMSMLQPVASVTTAINFSTDPPVTLKNTDGQFIDGKASGGWVTLLPSVVYLPLVLNDEAGLSTRPLITTPMPAITQRPVVVEGETFYTHTLSLATSLPADGYFYFSNDSHQVLPVLVDDQLALVQDEQDIFTYTFSLEGESPKQDLVEVPRQVVNTIVESDVILAYRDVYGVVVEASEMWLIWSPSEFSSKSE